MGDHQPFAPTPATPQTTRTAAGETVRIRPLASAADGKACVELQRHVWGWDQADIVPATLLHIVEYVGGLAAGAFDQHGTLLGFVFGVSGVRDGELAHWSHMLGVRETARNLGIGRLLKEYQRTTLAARAITRIYWSFDPLMAKNAYFNLNRLGANVVDYVPDMYGSTDSPLHLGLPTDRLVVRLDTPGPAATAVRGAAHDRLPILSAFPRQSDVRVSAGERAPDSALIEIPTDILGVVKRSRDEAATWRFAVREHVQWALSRGYAISGVELNAEAGRCFYLVSRAPSDSTGAATSTAPSRAVHVSPA